MEVTEKAIDLLKKFKPLTMVYQNKIWVEDRYAQRQCALICVDEIIKDSSNSDYWQQVKKEINKI